MSRSRKKRGIIKDKGCDSSFYNRRFRRINKLRLHLKLELLLLPEVVDDYIICDYKLRYQAPLEGNTINKKKAQRLWLNYYRK